MSAPPEVEVPSADAAPGEPPLQTPGGTPMTPGGTRLEDEIAKMQASMDMALNVTQSAARQGMEMDERVSRARKKSRELEMEVFGMGMEDVERLRKIFSGIDKDGSGALDPDELKVALIRAGKDASEEVVLKIFEKYDYDKSGTLEFSEYQSMIADWDNVVKTIDEETARIERAKAAAAPPAVPASWDAAAPSGPTESAPAPA